MPHSDHLTRRVLAGLIGFGFAMMLALNLPGQMSYDSVVQLWDGRTGFGDSWHPPVMAWLLGLGDHLWPGTGLFVLLDAALLAGAWMVLLAPTRGGWGAVLVAALVLLTPQFLLYQGIVWKDVLFADAAIAAFAALAGAARAWPKMGARWCWLAAGATLLILAILARQNGLVLAPVWALALGAIAARHQGRGQALAYGAGLLVLTLLLAAAADLALANAGDKGEGARSQLRLAQTYDLAGAVKRDPALTLPLMAARDPALEKLIRDDGARLYAPWLVDELERSPRLIDAINSAPAGLVFAQWRALLLAHPLLYLRVRWPVFLWVAAPHDLMVCHPDVVGIDGAPEMLKALGIAPGTRPQDRWLFRYTSLFFGTPVFSHLFFAGLGLLLLMKLLGRRRGADLAVAGLLGGALLFAASFFVVSIACDYRYLYFLDLSALTAALYYAGAAAPVTVPPELANNKA